MQDENRKIKGYLQHLRKKKYYMRATYKKVQMVSWGGHKHAPYDVAIDYIPQNGLVYSFGLGDQIGLEEKLIKIKQCTVYGYDPMPNSEKYVLGCNLDNLHFFRIAIANHDGEEKCYYPENRNYISGSLKKENVGWQKLSDEYFMTKCYKLKTLMKMNNHRHIHMLKLCVEGMEFDVMDDILTDGLEIDQIAIAFCGRGLKGGFEKEKNLYYKMLNSGYECLPYGYSGKITFIKSEVLNSMRCFR